MRRKQLMAGVILLLAMYGASGFPSVGKTVAVGKTVTVGKTVAAGKTVTAGKTAQEEEGVTEEKSVPELTIWLDSDSEYVVRKAMNNYAWLSQSYGAGNEAYPELTWKLVDKSYLTPEQIRAELEQELERGVGPDLIYIDEYNGIDPQALMESGYLMELEGITDKALFSGEWQYLPGTLEAGQLEGRQLVLPVYVQCPVVFGIEEELLQAGLQTEEEYESLEELLEALTAAAERTGKQIFENPLAVDWIEAYCLAGDTETKTAELLDQVREHCGSAEGFFAPYESLENGESLLTGCCLDNLQKIAQNLSMIDKEKSIAFLPVPSWDGECRAVITQSVAVNANTSHPAEARALAAIFQESFVNGGVDGKNGFPAIAANAYWQDILDGSVWATDTVYEKRGRQISGTDQVARRLRQSTQKAVTAAMFGNGPSDSSEVGDEGISEEKVVLTIAFGDRGLGEEYPIYRWLQSAADSYSNERLQVQLVPAAAESFVPDLVRWGAGTDIILYPSAIFIKEYAFPGEIESYADLTALLDGQEGLCTVAADGEIKGISCGWLKMTDGSRGWDYVFAIPKTSGNKEEAVEFCLAALQDENCRTALEESGYLPLE